jgi:hypothetical protein
MDNIENFVKGKPGNLVNGAYGAERASQAPISPSTRAGSCANEFAAGRV